MPEDQKASKTPPDQLANEVPGGAGSVGWAEHRRAIEEDYGQYVAVADIRHGDALAYAVGHPVPASNVDKHGYADAGLVAKVGTKAAREAQGLPAEEEK